VKGTVKVGITLVIVILLMLGLTSLAFAWSTGYLGVSNYAQCGYEDRAGRQYVTNLHNEIKSWTSNSYIKTDNNAWAKHMIVSQSGGDGTADSVNFFAWSGHGLTTTNYQTAHPNSANGTLLNHGTYGELISDYNARTFEIEWGPDKMRWATMYTCRFGSWSNTTKQNYYKKMFKGLRLLMAFDTVMYLDSREGTEYGKRLTNGQYIRTAFVDAAKIYQKNHGFTVKTAVGGWNSAWNDTRYSSTSRAPNWSDSSFTRQVTTVS
jgi:hypothetical protein